MKFKPDYKTNTVLIDDQLFALPALQEFLIDFYPQLVSKFFLRAVTKSGTFVEVQRMMINGQIGQRTTITKKKTEFHYDWKEIFSRCERTIIPLHDFLNQNK